jgi:hypothetical protein
MGGYQFLNYLEDEENIHTETLDEILEIHLIDVRRYYYPLVKSVISLGRIEQAKVLNR